MVELVLRGVVAPGLGKAAQFTELPWVWRQFADKLGLHAWPGTFNVRVTDPADQAHWHALATEPGIEIEPATPGACVAHCYPVVINDSIRGAIILPHVRGYPPDQIEIVAAEQVRAALKLGDGDEVVLRVAETIGPHPPSPSPNSGRGGAGDYSE